MTDADRSYVLTQATLGLQNIKAEHRVALCLKRIVDRLSTATSTPQKAPDMANPEQPQPVASAGGPPERPPSRVMVGAFNEAGDAFACDLEEATEHHMGWTLYVRADLVPNAGTIAPLAWEQTPQTVGDDRNICFRAYPCRGMHYQAESWFHPISQTMVHEWKSDLHYTPDRAESLDAAKAAAQAAYEERIGACLTGSMPTRGTTAPPIFEDVRDCPCDVLHPCSLCGGPDCSGLCDGSVPGPGNQQRSE